MENKLILLICIILTVSCSQNKPEQTSVVNIVKSSDTDGLEFWTDDTVFYTNPTLVRIMDVVYRYTRSDNFPSSNIIDDIRWMDNFRDSLCVYYKKTYSIDSISTFAMVDSVISEARKLWSLDTDESTMGMIVNNSVERTRLIFEHFNEFSKLNSICKTEKQRTMLLDEFDAWIKLEQIFSGIYADCVDLEFWGGSIAGPIRTSGYLALCQCHIDLYKKEYNLLIDNEDEWTDTGTFLPQARQLLIECCKQAIKEYYYKEDECDERYEDTYKDVKHSVSKLPQYIDQWINKRKPWEEEMCTDWLRPAYSRNTAEVLIRMSSLICSVR